MTEKQERGALGEQAAVDYLRRNGFMIVERNYRIGYSEVDIIAQRYDELHFVEVKTRKAGSMTTAESAINEQKQRAWRPTLHNIAPVSSRDFRLLRSR